MSYFGICLDEMIKRKGMKAVDVAKQSGVGESLISRYRSGEQVWVSPDDLEALSKTLTTDPAEHAELLRAHLLDECHGPGAKLIQISYSGHQLKELPTPYLVKLPDNLERHFAVLREHVIKDKNVRDVIEGLGNLLSSGDCRTDEEPAELVSSTGEAGNLESQLVDQLKAEVGEKTPKKKPARRKSSQSPSA